MDWALTISIISILFTVFVFWFSNYRKIFLKLYPESQIQLLSGGKRISNEGVESELIALNLLYNITASGPQSKWNVFKFEESELLTPQGRKIIKPLVYLDETSDELRNNPKQLVRSRIVPIAVKGGDTMAITAAFSVEDMAEWVDGKYILKIKIVNGNNISILGDKVFILNSKDVSNISKSGKAGIYMKPFEVV